MSWRVNLQSGQQLCVFGSFVVFDSLFVSRGIYHVVKVANFVELGSLDLCGFAISVYAIGSEFDSVALSHCVVNSTHNCIRCLKLHMQV
jgi:hypothetical protein